MTDNDGTSPGVAMNELRWAKIPKDKRVDHVPRNGGRPRLYPPCPNNKTRHRWDDDVCKSCGYQRDPDVLQRRVGLEMVKHHGPYSRILMKVRE
jgi:hypothetical protein